MSKNTSVSLGDHFVDFIDHQLAQGRYGSASDVVRAALRLLEDEELRLATLRAALIEGEQSGPAKAFEPQTFLNRMHAEHSRPK